MISGERTYIDALVPLFSAKGIPETAVKDLETVVHDSVDSCDRQLLKSIYIFLKERCVWWVWLAVPVKLEVISCNYIMTLQLSTGHVQVRSNLMLTCMVVFTFFVDYVHFVCLLMLMLIMMCEVGH